MTQVQEVKAIQTSYAGCRFRSRIEARWAVFFDYLGIGWEYEPQGFDLPSGPYLPDFLLDLRSPESGGVWWEVKGAQPLQREMNLAWELFEATHKHVYVAHGAIPRDEMDLPRISHVGSTPVRWAIWSTGVGFVPNLGGFDQVGTAHPVLLEAFRAARSARFEHGESPLHPQEGK